MKDFFKNVFATIVGIYVAGFIFIAFLFISLVAAIISTNSTQPLKENSVLTINLTGTMNERAEDMGVLEKVGGKMSNQIGLDDFLKGVRLAKNDNNIKGIYIEAGSFMADSYASLQEARNALNDFKKSGKWIIAYGDTYTQQAYYLSSVANEVYLNPQGMIDWHGLASQPLFIKDALAKFGVKMQIAKVGKYKSATEMFSEDKMSDANRAQTSAYLKSIWNNVVKEVSESRKLTTQQLNAYADSAITFAAPSDYKKMKLVDGLIYTDQVKQVVKKKLGLDNDKDVCQIMLKSLIDNDTQSSDAKHGVAIYYAYGEIIDSRAGNPINQNGVIDAQIVCKDLERLAGDDDIKAVVLRINSPGGSAYASEQIWHQVVELKKKKPVVVSMGGMAASGGYYSAAAANWILADPTTLTGSIGIFGIFPDASGLLTEKLGVKFDEVATNKHSAFGSPARPFNADEMRILQQYIERGYQLFRSRVAEGRHLTTEQVEQIAQGHVFSGEDALKIKLVDQLGGIDKAIDKAAQLAGLKDYFVSSYPAMQPWYSSLLEEDMVDNYLNTKMRETLGDFYQPFTLLKQMNYQSAIQARIPFQPNIH